MSKKIRRTKKQERDLVEHTVDVAIMQCAESSGLRSWLLAEGFKYFDMWKNEPNVEEVLLQGYDSLIGTFANLVPDEHKYKFVLSVIDYDRIKDDSKRNA